MKRFGYTLAEALIAMTVVGIIAAITMPLVNKFMPDTNKVMYLKTYDAIVEATQMMTTSSNMYPMIVKQENGDLFNYKNAPLASVSPANIDGEFYGRASAAYPQYNTKYCELLSLAFGSSEQSCVADYVNAPFTLYLPSFTSQNGVSFEIYTDSVRNNNTVSYQSVIYFDVNGFNEGKNCMYDANTCTQPDRFKLLIASDGKIVAADPKGRAYLAKRSTFKLNKDEECDENGILANLLGNDLVKNIEIIGNDNGGSGDDGGDDDNTGSGDDGGDDDNTGSGDDGGDDDGTGSGDDGTGSDLEDPLKYTCNSCGRRYLVTGVCTCRCGAPIICTTPNN